MDTTDTYAHRRAVYLRSLGLAFSQLTADLDRHPEARAALAGRMGDLSAALEALANAAPCYMRSRATHAGRRVDAIVSDARWCEPAGSCDRDAWADVVDSLGELSRLLNAVDAALAPAEPRAA